MANFPEDPTIARHEVVAASAPQSAEEFLNLYLTADVEQQILNFYEELKSKQTPDEKTRFIRGQLFNFTHGKDKDKKNMAMIFQLTEELKALDNDDQQGSSAKIIAGAERALADAGLSYDQIKAWMNEGREDASVVNSSAAVGDGQGQSEVSLTTRGGAEDEDSDAEVAVDRLKDLFPPAEDDEFTTQEMEAVVVDEDDDQRQLDAAPEATVLIEDNIQLQSAIEALQKKIKQGSISEDDQGQIIAAQNYIAAKWGQLSRVDQDSVGSESNANSIAQEKRLLGILDFSLSLLESQVRKSEINPAGSASTTEQHGESINAAVVELRDQIANLQSQLDDANSRLQWGSETREELLRELEEARANAGTLEHPEIAAKKEKAIQVLKDIGFSDELIEGLQTGNIPSELNPEQAKYFHAFLGSLDLLTSVVRNFSGVEQRRSFSNFMAFLAGSTYRDLFTDQTEQARRSVDWFLEDRSIIQTAREQFRRIVAAQEQKYSTDLARYQPLMEAAGKVSHGFFVSVKDFVHDVIIFGQETTFWRDRSNESSGLLAVFAKLAREEYGVQDLDTTYALNDTSIKTYDKLKAALASVADQSLVRDFFHEPWLAEALKYGAEYGANNDPRRPVPDVPTSPGQPRSAPAKEMEEGADKGDDYLDWGLPEDGEGDTREDSFWGDSDEAVRRAAALREEEEVEGKRAKIWRVVTNGVRSVFSKVGSNRFIRLSGGPFPLLVEATNLVNKANSLSQEAGRSDDESSGDNQLFQSAPTPLDVAQPPPQPPYQKPRRPLPDGSFLQDDFDQAEAPEDDGQGDQKDDYDQFKPPTSSPRSAMLNQVEVDEAAAAPTPQPDAEESLRQDGQPVTKGDAQPVDSRVQTPPADSLFDPGF